MVTLESLKQSLRQTAKAETSSSEQPLSNTQYSAGFDILTQGGSEWATYQDFILPQLTQLLASLADTKPPHSNVSVLEIGPGPRSVLGSLPVDLRRMVGRYAAFEPNDLFATRLGEWLRRESETGFPLPCLESQPDIRRVPFTLDTRVGAHSGGGSGGGASDGGEEKFDLVLFCHSMYGMNPKSSYIERALDMLVDERPAEEEEEEEEEGGGNGSGGMVVVFHRDGALRLDGLVCHRTASFPTGMVRVSDDDETLDRFAPFIAGFVARDADSDEGVRAEWRRVCRALGRREDAFPDYLAFDAPCVMAAFTRHATSLPELMAEVPVVAMTDGDAMTVKNREARLHRPAAIVRPTEIQHVQRCVRWALRHGVGLTVVGGGHSGHCFWPNVVAVDMGAFNQIHILTAKETAADMEEEEEEEEEEGSSDRLLVVAGAGCKTGDIVRETTARGATVPLGACPSVGAGIWLQGGVGHLARSHGLSCDAVVGAVLVGVDSGKVLCVGRVPRRHRPAGAVRPDNNEAEMLWAMRGAGTNFGVVVSVTFAAHAAAPMFLTRNWVVPLRDGREAKGKIADFDRLVARRLPRTCSADAYLYWERGRLHLGVSMFQTSTQTELRAATQETPPIPTSTLTELLGVEHSVNLVDGVGLFETEMYRAVLHGGSGHGGIKTSSFKRCVFLKDIGSAAVADRLVSAIAETRPSPLCYLHLLQGGGAVADVAETTTAFGCRQDWGFACVITGVWPREQHDGTDAAAAAAAVKWVYDVAGSLLPLSAGAYAADLGPDPRDAALATGAFGPNMPGLARLKRALDPRNVLAYAFPLSTTTDPTQEQKQQQQQQQQQQRAQRPRLIVLVTGESGAGKDFCADVWVSFFAGRGLSARAVSISDAAKREYAAETTGVDLHRLLCDREYKERHRAALMEFFQARVAQRPSLPEEHFLDIVSCGGDGGDGDVDDVLFVTGMRDEAPVANLAHLVPGSRLVEVRVEAGEETRRRRRRGFHGQQDGESRNTNINERDSSPAETYRSDLILTNDRPGPAAATHLAEHHLLPFLDGDLHRLAGMVRAVPDFPRRGVRFRHVLGIVQQPGGLDLCSSLLRDRFVVAYGDWDDVDAVVCCEAGGFVFAAALVAGLGGGDGGSGVRLVLVRSAGKLPPPVVSVDKAVSHISSRTNGFSGAVENKKLANEKEKKEMKEAGKIEMDRDAVPHGSGTVVIVDDVLASGETLCAVLRLLGEAGVGAERVRVLVVAEFPAHRGRALLRRRGFGRVSVQSLLVFDGF